MPTTAPGRVRPDGTRAAPGPGAGLLLAALATVVWSGSFITSRALHDSVPPVQAAFWRWVVAVAAVAPFALRAAWRQRALIRARLPYLLVALLLGVTLYNTLVNQAGLTTTAGNMGMIMAASPVLMALFDRFGGARLGPRRTAGMLLACAGVVLLVGDGTPSFDPRPGDLWMFGAALSFAAYSALLRRRPPEIDAAVFLFATFVTGTLLLAPAFAASVVLQGGFEPATGTVGPLVYVGVCSSAVAFFAWNRAVALVGPARAGAVYQLQPVCVALLGHVLLGESLGGVGLLCMALILGGVALAAARET